jgi:hypothetical protein
VYSCPYLLLHTSPHGKVCWFCQDGNDGGSVLHHEVGCFPPRVLNVISLIAVVIKYNRFHECMLSNGRLTVPGSS